MHFYFTSERGYELNNGLSNINSNQHVVRCEVNRLYGISMQSFGYNAANLLEDHINVHKIKGGDP